MNRIKASLLPAALMGTIAIGSGLATTAFAQDPYTVGVEASFPPWAYGEAGEFKGIAIDAMEAIAEEAGDGDELEARVLREMRNAKVLTKRPSLGCRCYGVRFNLHPALLRPHLR